MRHIGDPGNCAVCKDYEPVVELTIGNARGYVCRACLGAEVQKWMERSGIRVRRLIVTPMKDRSHGHNH